MKLLAVITEAATTRACLDAAVAAARIDLGTRVEALHVVVDPEQLVTSSEEVQIQRLRETQEGSAEQRAQAVHSAFVAWNLGADEKTPRVDWNSIVGSEEETLAREAQSADLVIIARGHDLDSTDAQHAALLATGKPVLLVPGDWRPRGPALSHIAVALSDSPKTEDAIRGAMPWLQAAQRITALHIGSKDDLASAPVHQLRDAGLAAELHIAAPSGGNRGEQIVAEAKGIGADALVAGAYGHGQLTEWLLGGTTRHMLAAAELPLLLAH
ncbi:MAG: universal stress protein [Sphingomonadaceae bacterium]|nr:universal stress protein [Sphingomonadaceae bacterium]